MTYGSDPFSYDFEAALNAAGSRPATYMEKLESGELAREITYGYGRPTRSKHGKVLVLSKADAVKLENHRKLYGKEGVELPDERRTVAELRESGLSVREIARIRGISESRVRTQLRIAA